jgi:hypothetical protein
LAFGHRLEQSRLHLGGGAVDLVGQDEVVKDGTALKAEAPVFGAIDVGAGQVGRQQIGRELDAVIVSLHRRRECTDCLRLGESGCALDQEMTVGQQRDQQAVDQIVLPQDATAEMAA